MTLTLTLSLTLLCVVKAKTDLRKGFKDILKGGKGRREISKEFRAKARDDFRLQAQAVFRDIDLMGNRSGRIERKELGMLMRDHLGLDLDDQQLRQAFMRIDKNLSGAIDFEEFWAFCSSYCI